MTVLLEINDIDHSFLPDGKFDPADETHIDLIVDKFRRDRGAEGFFADVHCDGLVVQITRNEEAEKELADCIELFQLGGFKPALHRLKPLLEKYPYHRDLLYNYGMALREVGEVEESIQLLDRATKIAPDHSHAWVALSVSNQTIGRIDDALAAINRAFEIDGEDPFVLRTLGYLLESKGELEKASIHLEKVLQLSPSDPQAHLVLGKIKSSTSPEDAADHFKWVQKNAPGSPMASLASDLLDQL